MNNLVNLSKFISLVLRHKPYVVGLKLDKEGYVGVDDLIDAINKNSNYSVDLNTLITIVETDNKRRYSFDKYGTRVRANQGHSVKVDLGLKEVTPPKILYHGTGEKYLSSILEKGLISKSRLHVHLSEDIKTAINVGSRHGNPVVLVVDTERMLKDKYKFFLSENGVWLINSVPSKYLKVYR